MPEIGSSGLMSGDGKRGDGRRPQVTAPILNSTNADMGGEKLLRCKQVSFPHSADHKSLL